MNHMHHGAEEKVIPVGRIVHIAAFCHRFFEIAVVEFPPDLFYAGINFVLQLRSNRLAFQDYALKDLKSGFSFIDNYLIGTETVEFGNIGDESGAGDDVYRRVAPYFQFLLFRCRFCFGAVGALLYGRRWFVSRRRHYGG